VPALRATRLLDQVRERIRYLHNSLSTEKVYLHWIKYFIHGHGRDGSPMRHPREIGTQDVESFLTMLATERKANNRGLTRIIQDYWDLNPLTLLCT
jgi:Phage integrase, N-terminal SAM-like domain